MSDTIRAPRRAQSYVSWNLSGALQEFPYTKGLTWRRLQITQDDEWVNILLLRVLLIYH